MYYGGIPQLGRLLNFELLIWVVAKSKFSNPLYSTPKTKTNGIPLLNDPWMAARNENGMRDGDRAHISMHV